MARKNIKGCIQEHFFIFPSAKMRVREIERELRLPLPSVIRYCSELEKERILMKVRIGDVVFFTSDRTSPAFLLEKRLFNQRQIHHSGMVEYLKKTLGNPLIILFGSYARGEDIETSDVDLFIGTASKKEVSLGSYEKRLHRPIQVIRHDGVARIANKHLANNIINGITLNGYLEVFR